MTTTNTTISPAITSGPTALAAALDALLSGTSVTVYGVAELDALLSNLIPPVGVKPVANPRPPESAGLPLPHPYHFPHKQALLQWNWVLKVHLRTEDRLLEVLEKLSFWRDPKTGRVLPYSVVRDLICAINLRLNLLNAIAPGLRPNRRPPAPREGRYTADDTLLVNDRQVIDLEWLRARVPVLPKPKHRAMFGHVDLDWTAASRFVSTVGSIDDKTEDLGLSEDAQLGCMALCTDRVKKRREAAMERTLLLTRQLAARAVRTTSRADLRSIPRKGRVFVALQLAGGSPKAAATLYNLYFEEDPPADARDFSNCKREFVRLGFKV